MDRRLPVSGRPDLQCAGSVPPEDLWVCLPRDDQYTHGEDDGEVRLNPLSIRAVRRWSENKTAIIMWVEGEAGPIIVKATYEKTCRAIDKAMAARSAAFGGA